MPDGDELAQYAASDLSKYAKKAPPVPQTSMRAADPRSITQRLGDWWVRKPGTFEGTLDKPSPSPRERAQAVGQGAAVASLPLLGGGLAMAPGATLLGLGGGAAGGYAGSKAGSYLGEQVGAPELGSDVGGLTGSILGGTAGAMGARPLGNKAASLLRSPATARQSQLGRPGSVKDILPPQLQRWTLPPWMIPKGEIGTPTNPGPFMEVPAKMPKPNLPTPEVDPLTLAVRQGIAARIPTKMPPTASLPLPPRFPGATPTSAVLGQAELPTLPPNLAATAPEIPGVNAPLGPKAPPTVESPILSLEEAAKQGGMASAAGGAPAWEAQARTPEAIRLLRILKEKGITDLPPWLKGGNP